MDTLTETMERILEIAEITDNIRTAELAGELTQEQARGLINTLTDGECCNTVSA